MAGPPTTQPLVADPKQTPAASAPAGREAGAHVVPASVLRKSERPSTAQPWVGEVKDTAVSGAAGATAVAEALEAAGPGVAGSPGATQVVPPSEVRRSAVCATAHPCSA